MIRASLPEKIGRYEIMALLGRGAMGVVYHALDPLIRRPVAIKLVHRDDFSPGDSEREFARFQREAQAAGALSHPNIVGIHGYNEFEDHAYIVMEFVAGHTLRQCQEQQQTFSLEEISGIMTGLLAALECAHTHGVIHRDIKPSNIMLSDQGEVKITDFGIARIEDSPMTQAGAVLGTLSYMSPEQFVGAVADRRSDLYSAGAVLYQLLTGERPFKGNAATITQRVLNEMPEPPTLRNPALPPSVDTLIARALAKAPAERFPSARAFHAALSAGLGIPAPPFFDPRLLQRVPEIAATAPGHRDHWNDDPTLALPPRSAPPAAPARMPAGVAALQVTARPLPPPASGAPSLRHEPIPSHESQIFAESPVPRRRHAAKSRLMTTRAATAHATVGPALRRIGRNLVLMAAALLGGAVLVAEILSHPLGLAAMTTLWPALDLRQAAASAEAPVASSGSQHQAEFAAALALFHSGDLQAARTAFSGFTNRWPDDALADEALYSLGLTQFLLGQYLPAADRFRRLGDLYPRSARIPEAMLRRGIALARMGITGEACATLAASAAPAAEGVADWIPRRAVTERQLAGCEQAGPPPKPQ